MTDPIPALPVPALEELRARIKRFMARVDCCTRTPPCPWNDRLDRFCHRCESRDLINVLAALVPLPATPTRIHALARTAAMRNHCRWKEGTKKFIEAGHSSHSLACSHPDCVLVRESRSTDGDVRTDQGWSYREKADVGQVAPDRNAAPVIDRAGSEPADSHSPVAFLPVQDSPLPATPTEEK